MSKNDDNEATKNKSVKSLKSTSIPLYEIDPDIIKDIRELHIEDTSYKILKESISKEGQHHPITLRMLTDNEKQKAANKEAKYGIIDGHHRFHIAKEKNVKKIPAIIINHDLESDKSNGDMSELEYQDIAMALRLNESSIKMSTLEKGRIIYELAEKTHKRPSDIGSDIFKIKGSRSYECWNAYKKSINEKTIEKPRENNYDKTTLETVFNDLISREIDENNINQSIEQLELIKKVKEQLNLMSKKLLTKQVKEEFMKRARDKRKSSSQKY